MQHNLKPLKRYNATNTLLEMYAQYQNISILDYQIKLLYKTAEYKLCFAPISTPISPEVIFCK